MRVLFSEIVGLPVYAAGKRLIAVTKNVTLDAEKGKILAINVHPGKNNVILPMDFEINQHSVLLFDENAVLDIKDIVRLQKKLPELFSFIGLPVYTEEKKYLGIVRDFEFDSVSMMLTAFSCSRGMLFWKYDERIFPRRDIVKVTKEAVTVEDDTEKVKDAAKAFS